MSSVAIIGASNDRSKFGNKAVRAYLQKGWTVSPVSRDSAAIEGLKAYPSILQVPGPIDRVSLYVPPGIGLTLLDDIAAVQPGEVFFNPGTESDEALAKARQLGLNVVQACSIIDIGVHPAQLI